MFEKLLSLVIASSAITYSYQAAVEKGEQIKAGYACLYSIDAQQVLDQQTDPLKCLEEKPNTTLAGK